MHSAHIAERILALVTSRDRAASTVGDLTERAAARDAVWFWSSVLRTAASFLWRDVAEHAARLTGLALLGIAFYIAIRLPLCRPGRSGVFHRGLQERKAPSAGLYRVANLVRRAGIG
jgi:hypothetical protein